MRVSIPAIRSPRRVTSNGDVTPDLGLHGGTTIHFEGNNYAALFSAENHSMDYYCQITQSVDSDSWTTILSQPGDTEVFIGAQLVASAFIVDSLMSGINTIASAGNDTLTDPFGADYNVYYGARGVDVLTGGSASEVFLGRADNDAILGGFGFDTVYGGDGDDFINCGYNGDLIFGGAGNDQFQFLHALDGVVNIDTVLDFQSGQDVMELSAAVFTVFSGQIGSFVITSANLTYNSVTGVVAYDANGAGPAAPVTFAVLGLVGHPALLGNDFLIVS